MVSFQCSPLATADGILGTFRQCAQFQRGKNKDSFVSVVVLDEVGLAEDSEKMPLKVCAINLVRISLELLAHCSRILQRVQTFEH